MSQDKTCLFCHGPITEGDVCGWCGFGQQGSVHLPGTLDYGTKVYVYITGDVIAVDGESTSYLAYDTENQRKVILKEFLPVSIVAPRDGNTVKVQPGKEVLFKNLMMDFADLYGALAKVSGKSVQKVLSIFYENGTVYAALEYIKGDTLAQNLIKRGKPYTYKEARWLFQEIFLLLKQLEKLNIAHGGISDETVIITPDNVPVLTGFAIRDLRVKNEHIKYKLYDGFSAPEQYAANRFPGFYTDIYSVSALFYYAVTGKTYTDGALDSRDVSRHMPKYAVEALKYATKPDWQDRIDNIDDFVLMLDNKATVEKPPQQKKKVALPAGMSKRYIPYIAVAVILVLFVSAIMSMNVGTDISSRPSASDIQQERLTVPDLMGRSYSDVMNDTELNSKFYFYVSEEYSSEHHTGEIISQQPLAETPAEEGMLIYITVSKGEPMLTVPDNLAGKHIDNVKEILDSMGIRYAVLEKVQTKQYPHNIVQGTDRAPGTEINPDKDLLVVYVSDNTPLSTPSPKPTATPQPTPVPTPEPTPEPTPRPTAEPTPQPTETPPEDSETVTQPEDSGTEETE